MANSYITKKALGEALKYLVRSENLSRISIQDICDRCHLCRKSFYYHFDDKYDLVNWIFDNEFLRPSLSAVYPDVWSALEELCKYLFLNFHFYRKVLKDEDGRAFISHVKNTACHSLKDRFDISFGEGSVGDLSVSFYTDAFCCALERWMLEKEPVHYTEFVSGLRRAVETASLEICRNIKDAEKEEYLSL